MKLKIGQTISDGDRTYFKDRDGKLRMLPTHGSHADFVVSAKELNKKLELEK